MGSPSVEGRLSDPFSKQQVAPFNINSPGVCLVPGECREVCSPRERSWRHVGERGNRRSSGEGTGFLQPAFSSSKTIRKVEAGVGCLQTKQVRSENEILDGNTTDRTGGHQRRGLDDLFGHERCLFSCPHPSSVPKVSKIRVQQEDLPVQGTLLRAKYSPPGVHESDGTFGEDCSSGGVQDGPLPGRLVGYSQFKKRDVESERICTEVDRRVGSHNKPRKVSFGPISVFNIPRHGDRLHSFLGFSHSEASGQRIRNMQKILGLKSALCKVLAKLAGAHGFFGEVGPRRQTTHEEDTVLFKRGLGQESRVEGDIGIHPFKTERRPGVVELQAEVRERVVSENQDSRSYVIYRCFPRELGRHVGLGSSVGEMEYGRKEGTYKYARIEGNLECPEGTRKPSQEQDHSHLCRQYNSSKLCSETGRNKVMATVLSGKKTTSVDGGSGHYSGAQIHRRQEECSGGCLEQERASCSYRMDPEHTSVREIVETLGSSTDRPVCYKFKQEVTSVLRASPGSSSPGSRCDAAVMGRNGCICFSSVCNGQEGNQQAQGFTKLSHDPSCSLVASARMVSRPNPTSGIETKDIATQKGSSDSASRKSTAPKSPHTSSDRVETIIRLGRAKELSGQVSQRIIAARRPSTNELYQVRWKQFVLWCRKNKVSAIRPSVNNLCKFFIHLWEDKNLAVGTIKGFRSTLHSVLRHTNLAINTNQDISDVIRSFVIEKPVVRRETVSWNVDVVLRFLCSDRFEPLQSASLKDLTKKTLFLVSLALAKRVSEIQALSRAVGFSKEGAVVSLVLSFRAKNDNKYKDLPRSFVIKDLTSIVGREEERKLCPVRALRAYLERTRSFATGHSDRLFVAPSNPSRPASKNAISFLLKKLIRQAHEELCPDLLPILKVKPQEIRAVSTSLSYTHNLSLDAVIEAAQWRSNSVFASNYLKDVCIEYENCRTLGPLVTAGTIIP